MTIIWRRVHALLSCKTKRYLFIFFSYKKFLGYVWGLESFFFDRGQLESWRTRDAGVIIKTGSMTRLFARDRIAGLTHRRPHANCGQFRTHHSIPNRHLLESYFCFQKIHSVSFRLDSVYCAQLRLLRSARLIALNSVFASTRFSRSTFALNSVYCFNSVFALNSA